MNHPVIFQSGHNTLSRQLFVKLILSSESFFGTKKEIDRNANTGKSITTTFPVLKLKNILSLSIPFSSSSFSDQVARSRTELRRRKRGSRVNSVEYGDSWAVVRSRWIVNGRRPVVISISLTSDFRTSLYVIRSSRLRDSGQSVNISNNISGPTPTLTTLPIRTSWSPCHPW